MTSLRRTRRDVLCTAVGLGLAVTAGCLDESDTGGSSDTDGSSDDGGNGADDGGPGIDQSPYRRLVRGTDASTDLDLSELEFESFDITALDAVSSSIPVSTDEELRREAYDIVPNAREEFGEENIDGTFSFESRGTYDVPGSVDCQGVEGSFDVESFREKIDDDEDLTHRRIGGFDVYTWSVGDRTASTVISPDLAVRLVGALTEEETASLVERIESGALESAGERDDFETIADRLDDGAFVGGELRPDPSGAGEVGYGVSTEMTDATATTRIVTLYEGEPETEAIEAVEQEFEGSPWSEAYDDVTVDVDGRVIVATATVEADRFDPMAY